MKPTAKLWWTAVVTLLLSATVLNAQLVSELQRGFLQPPPTARPWVYWFWLNGNITREGITADLEAMQRVGIGGVLIMEVDQGAPVGPVPFMSEQWRALFKHVVAEAQTTRSGSEHEQRRGLEWQWWALGPPLESMQEIVWTEAELVGPAEV